MTDGILEMRAHREVWLHDRISIRMLHKFGAQPGDPLKAAHHISVVQPVILKQMDPRDYATEIPAAFDLSPAEAQQFMDELWRVGIRPTEGAGSVGQLAATTRHLEDMRALVFHKAGMKAP